MSSNESIHKFVASPEYTYMNNFYYEVVAPTAKKYEYLFTIASTEKLNEWFIDRLAYEKSQGWAKLSTELLLVAIKLRKNQYIVSFFIENYVSQPPLLESLALRKLDVGPNGITVWHALAVSGDYKSLFAAIWEGLCDPNQQDSKGYNVWDYLALSGNKEAIEAVVENQAIISDNFWPCLMRSGNWGTIEYAMRKWALKLNVTHQYGRTLWHALAASGNYSALTNALQLKLFDPHKIVDNSGWTVWHYFAIHGGSVKDIEDAIKHKWCDPTLKNQENLTVWDHFVNNLNSRFAIEAIAIGKCQVSIDQLVDLCLTDLVPYLLTTSFKETIKNHSLESLFPNLDPTITKFMASALQALQNDAADPYLIFPSEVPFKVQLEMASLITQIYSLDVSNKLSQSSGMLMLFIAGLDNLSAIDLLVKIPALQHTSHMHIQMVLSAALKEERWEVINRLLLAVPAFRKAAVRHPEFLRASKESDLLLDIASIDNGGDGNINMPVKNYPTQRELFCQLSYGLIPLLRERTEATYDPKVLDAILKHPGFCFTLSFIFLYVSDHPVEIQDKNDTDNLKYFEKILTSLANTDFAALRKKQKLSKEDQTLIQDLDRFLQLLLFYHAMDFEELSNGNVVNHTNYQESFIFYYFSDTQGTRLKGLSTETNDKFTEMMRAYINTSDNNAKHYMPRKDFLGMMRAYRDSYEIKIKDIHKSSLDNFLVSYSRHTIAVKRDIENSDVFLIYDSSYRGRFLKKNGNPTKVKAEYLNGYLKSIFAAQNDTPTLDLYVAGFNFDRRSQSKILTLKP